MQKSTIPFRYDSVARSLHWGSALLIVAAFVMGLTIDVLPRESRPPYLNLHVLVGLAVVVLAAGRIAWRIGHPAPPPPADSGPLAVKATALGHGLLYLMMFAVPLIGFAPLFSRGRGVDFGLFQIASPIERTKDWIGPTTEVHEIAAYALIALAVGHVLAALWHHFARRDDVLLRMMPPRKA